MSFRKVISAILFLSNFCVFTPLRAQQKSQAVFQFTDGFIYGKKDSLKFGGTITIDRNNVLFISMDRSSGKKNSAAPLAITKVDHNKKDDLDFVADKPGSVMKLNHCNEVLHIYTGDKSDFLFAFESNHTYLIYHNNFTLIRFFISSGDYSLLKSLFPDS